METIKRSELVKWRRQIIENEYSNLNDMQLKAALHVSGPLLILAGAGSGKTTVLVNRISNLLRWGRAAETDELYGYYSEEEAEIIRLSAENHTALPDDLAQRLSVDAPAPWRILAITFTNKAANELKQRICDKVGESGLDIWASTFHAACGRILRSCGSELGYSSHFTVYDSDDQKRLVKDCLKALNIDEKLLDPRTVMHEISNAKDQLLTPEMLLSRAGSDDKAATIARIYKIYHERLLRADAMDFDDMIYNTVILLRDNPQILEKYSGQFRYIMVDEYQDTNHMQYELIRLLSGYHRNLCVVGDDDQSIYRFRGATIRNILDFEDDFENSFVIKLEQNYRSTVTILSAANSVIKNNNERKAKTLWTQNPQGKKIIRYNAHDEHDECNFILETIGTGIAAGQSYSDYAILYRMNSQSQNIERSFVRAGIPYRIIGGRRFYERREIRDMIAYLSVISNHSDDNRLKRIVNVPRRGIGDKTVSQAEEIGFMLGQSIFETMKHCDEFEVLIRSQLKLSAFCDLIEEMSALLESGVPVSEMYDKLLERSDYISYITKESDHPDDAKENLEELKSSIIRYEQENPETASLQDYLEEIALLTDIDSYNSSDSESCVVMMTLHSAKGLEFNNVIIPGMDENIFPSYMAQMSESEMQEERRLAYVGITRAKRRLYMLTARCRTIFGKTNYNRPSRFLSELPAELVEEKQKPQPEFTPPADRSIRERRKTDYASSRLITSSDQRHQTPAAEYKAGMRVRHKSFGEGMILNVRPMASDMLLEIAFDTKGTKKLMASYAQLTIL